MAVISQGINKMIPTLILGYRTSSEVPATVHDLLDGRTAYTLRPARPRTGTLQLFFSTYAAAWNAFNAHRQMGVLDLDYNEAIPAASMRYIVSGSVTLELEDTTRTRWIVSVPYREVAP